MHLIAAAINYTVNIINIIIFIRVLLSWLAPYTHNDFTDVVYAVSEPILKPFRMIFPVGYSRIDISPILAYFAINLIRRLLFYIIF
ncbi:YggT family protein [Fusobacterium perfoetens]|uniref:YggT family protein n=1 Tax=Fusobacterium perfoetens TaxID=852 RepID=UPI0015A18BAC|nr:YggT family protein [Fusobacterium perfoetens]MCF2625143.1 YggT family protein [Fusobacterium perfoetens]